MPNQPDLAALADQAFTEFESTLQGAPDPVKVQWFSVKAYREKLDMASTDTAATLAAINDDQFLTADVKALKTKLALEIFDSVDKDSTKGMEDSFARAKAELGKLAAVDQLRTPSPAESILLRQEIDGHMASDGGLTVSSLLRLAMNPRYTAEVSIYGPSVLARAGQPERIPELMRGVAAVAPRDTPGARTVQRSLAKIDKARGHVAGIAFKARQRVEAQQPQKRAGYQGQVVGNRLVR